MKRSCAAIVVISAVLGWLAAAEAETFSDVVDFPNLGNSKDDSGSSFVMVQGMLEYDHLLDFKYKSIDTASLAIRASNPGLQNELWVVNADQELLVGGLGTSNDWVTYTFTLDNTVRGLLASDAKLVIKVSDSVSGGSNNLKLSWSEISGTYTPVPNTTPVPIPSAVLLLGSGLAGLGIFGRRKKK